MSDPKTIVVDSIDEMVKIATTVTDEDKIFMTGQQFKESALYLLGVGYDIARGHQLCSDMGVPDLGGGTEGLVKRLEFLKENPKPGT